MISTDSNNKTVHTWQHQALAELLDVMMNILANRYESPEDFAEELHQRATAIATILSSDDPTAGAMMLTAIGSHVMALNFAANEIAMRTQEPRDQILARLQYAGWERYEASTPRELEHYCGEAIASIAKYRNLSINTAVPTDGRSQTA